MDLRRSNGGHDARVTGGRVLTLLVAGAVLWAAIAWAGYNGSMPFRLFDGVQWKALGFAAIVLLIGKLRRGILRLIDATRQPSDTARRVTFIAVTIVAGAYLYGTARFQGRELFPKMHDEHMHLVQMQLLSQGRLWLPAHPLADFFETFHIFHTPVYAPLHFPGTSLLYVPAIWLNAPYWLGPLCVASLIVGCTYLLLAELVDGWSGFIGALLLVSLAPFRYVSLIVVSNPVAMLLGLWMVLAWLRWRQQGGAGWAMALGVCAGWAAITRPPDALSFGVPIAVAIAVDWMTRKRARVASRWRGWQLAPAVLAAVPFLVVQLCFDHGVTGRWLHTPHDAYATRYNPGVNYGLRGEPVVAAPQTTLPQKQIYYASFVRPHVEEHRPDRLAQRFVSRWIPTFARTTLPHAILLIFLPLGFASLSDRRHWMVAMILPMALGLYALSVMISWYYLLFTAPALYLCIFKGVRRVESAWPAAREWIAPGISLFILAIAIANLPEARHEQIDQYVTPTLKAANEATNGLHEPSLVLFTFEPGENVHEEPVYTIDAARIDDARVIRAHDLGPRNIVLFRYYAGLQPDRQVYRFDRAEQKLYPLGSVASLAESTADTR